MKRFFISAAMACALAGMMASAAEKPSEKKPQPPTTRPTTQPAAPINKFCAVETDNPVDPTVPTVVYEGKTIGFCCEDCIPKFKKNPAYYLKGLK